MIIRGAARAEPAVAGQQACFAKDLVTSAETPALSTHRLRIEPGGEFTSHAHERETEMQFVISGQGQAQIGDQWEDVVGGDVALALPGVAHALRNNSASPLFILCVFTPPLV
jgi:quercetin dioxygenase-like cupin family protein